MSLKIGPRQVNPLPKPRMSLIWIQFYWDISRARDSFVQEFENLTRFLVLPPADQRTKRAPSPPSSVLCRRHHTLSGATLHTPDTAGADFGALQEPNLRATASAWGVGRTLAAKLATLVLATKSPLTTWSPYGCRGTNTWLLWLNSLLEPPRLMADPPRRRSADARSRSATLAAA